MADSDISPRYLIRRLKVELERPIDEHTTERLLRALVLAEYVRARRSMVGCIVDPLIEPDEADALVPITPPPTPEPAREPERPGLLLRLRRALGV